MARESDNRRYRQVAAFTDIVTPFTIAGMTTGWAKMPAGKRATWIIGLMLLVGTVLLFRGGPDYESPRSFRHAWDLGHIIYFALLTLLLSGWRPVARRTPAIQWTVILCITLIAGTLVELAQSGMQRNPDVYDLLRDVTGSVLILSFGPAGMPVRSRRWKLVLQTAVVAVLLLELWPLAKSLFDENMARRRFPLLADFEGAFETERWTGSDGLSIEKLPQAMTGRVLKLPLSTEQYSGAELFYFPGDWKQFDFLSMSIFNPDAQPLQLTVRIHDRQHTQGDGLYEDRFNRSVLLVHGWNHIELDLEEVASAPRNRRMDMGHVRGLGIFATALDEPRVIYLDNIRLQ
jgi:VanZ family protein